MEVAGAGIDEHSMLDGGESTVSGLTRSDRAWPII